MTGEAFRELVRHVRRGTAEDWVEVLRVVALALVAEVVVRRLPLSRAASIFGVRLGQDTTPCASGSPLRRWAVRKAETVHVVMAVWPGDGNCLRESLVLAHRVRSLRPELILGVRRHADVVQAHAWVVIAGVPFGAEDYAPLRSRGNSVSP